MVSPSVSGLESALMKITGVERSLVFEWVRNSANYTDVMPGDRSVTPPILLRGSLSPPGAGPSLS